MAHISRRRSARRTSRLSAPKRKAERKQRIGAKEIKKTIEVPAAWAPEPAEPGKQLVSRQTAPEDPDICSLTDETSASASDLH